MELGVWSELINRVIGLFGCSGIFGHGGHR